MARRDRVPRHKSHAHKRNKNAKLSPFQREQKRAKMANQVPTSSTIGSLDTVPHSQRRIFDYLQEKRARQQAKRTELEHARAGLQDEDSAAATASSSNVGSSRSSSKSTAAAAAETATASSPSNEAGGAPHTSKKKSKPQYASLNDELGASVGAAMQPLRSRHGHDAEDEGDAPRTVEEIIARKKERKHKRKQEARRARVAAEMQEAEAELEAYAKSLTGAGKRSRRKKDAAEGAEAERERVNLAFERKLRTMQKEEAAAAAASAAVVAAGHANGADAGAVKGRRKRQRGDATSEAEAVTRTSGDDGDGDDAAAPARQRKRISFDAEVEARAASAEARASAPAKPRKPQDFYELVDVVRYGERVEAPPVFDVVPNRHAAVSRLANALAREERRGGAPAGSAAGSERHRLLAGGGQLAQEKRLARLGLGPAVTHTTRADGAARMSKEAEIKALRDRVMATYQRNRRKEVVERKGVDMKHEFPQFS